ncbi:hypothetical protein, partial [Klebsiella pneumoniae]|uniref:hypothetical protein n=1 Tax=Klebsiella pneumoniae TaxID=573 RepID=UPI0025A0ADE8
RLEILLLAAVGVLQRVRTQISDDALAAAAGISDDLQKAAVLLGTQGIDAMREIVESEFPDLSIWARRVFEMLLTAIGVLSGLLYWFN